MMSVFHTPLFPSHQLWLSVGLKPRSHEGVQRFNHSAAAALECSPPCQQQICLGIRHSAQHWISLSLHVANKTHSYKLILTFCSLQLSSNLPQLQGCAQQIFYFGSVRSFFKKSDLVQNQFGSVRFKKHCSVRILQLFTTHIIAEQLIYRKYYSNSE